MAKEDSIEMQGTILETCPIPCSVWNWKMVTWLSLIFPARCAKLHPYPDWGQSNGGSDSYDLSKGRIVSALAKPGIQQNPSLSVGVFVISGLLLTVSERQLQR